MRVDSSQWVPKKRYDEVVRERDMLRRELSTYKKSQEITETCESSPASGVGDAYRPMMRPGYGGIDWLSSKD